MSVTIDEIERLEAEANAIRMIDEPEYIRIMREVERKKEELAKLQAEAVREAIIADAQDPESSFTLTVGGYTVDFRVEAASEEAYQALSIATRLKLQEMEEAYQAEIKALKASYDTEIAHNAQVIRQLKESNNQLELERTDFENKWKAATTQVSELAIDNQGLSHQNVLQQQENATLKNTIEELRNQVSKPNVPTNTDVSALVDAMSKLQASKPVIYNVVYDMANINYTANLLETDEVITGKAVYIGKYRIADQDEVKRFREEREEAGNNQLVQSTAAEEPVQVPNLVNQFQTEDEPTVPESPALGEVATEGLGTVAQVTREEFDELKRRVDVLYGMSEGVAA